jgi:phosphatidylserine/phosphatidylglycerophosphate/cardiolipin synthase-like enzyme
VKRLLIAVVFLMSVLGLTTALTTRTAQPAEAAPWRVTQGVFFNVPRNDDPAKVFRIERQILAAINHAPRGSVIMISVFSFDRMNVADALIEARRRGVQVRVLMNNHQTTGAMGRLYNHLGRDTTRPVFADTCNYGCRSQGENLHSKFFLFSRTGASENVVMVGSTNLMFNAADNQYNDLYVRADAPKLYDRFFTLFQQMRKDRLADPLYWQASIAPTFALQVLPYPKASATDDPSMRILNNIRCSGATGGTGTNGHTKVRISMHAWDGERGVYIAKKVRKLFGAGCDIKVTYGMASTPVRDVFATKTIRGYIPVHVAGYDTEVLGYDGVIDLYNHQKAITISGHFVNTTDASITFTGSANFQNSGVRGDEIILRINGVGVMNRYAHNFEWMYRNRSHLAKYIPYPRSVALAEAGATPPAHEATEDDPTSERSLRTSPATEPSPGGPLWEND